MAEQYPKPTVLDATVVSNFASTNAVEYLVEVLEAPVVVPAVRDEITEGYRHGYDYLETAIDAFDDRLPIIDVDRDAEWSEVRNRLDAGEAESLLAALQRDGGGDRRSGRATHCGRSEPTRRRIDRRTRSRGRTRTARQGDRGFVARYVA